MFYAFDYSYDCVSFASSKPAFNDLANVLNYVLLHGHYVQKILPNLGL